MVSPISLRASVLPALLCVTLTALACERPDATASNCPQETSGDEAPPTEPAAGEAAPAEVAAPERPQPPERFDLEAIDTYLAAEVEARGFVGLSVAIMRRGEIVFARGYGQRSLEPAAPADADTVFAMASNTKQFSCSLALLMAEDKALRMSDPVAKYYPGLTRAKEITLLDLFQHTSGYRDLYPMDFVISEMAQDIDTEVLVQRYGTMDLDFDPRTRWSYSNTGYLIAGRILETVGRKPLAELM
ncbi:MAG: beta-lactamase family protein, partial [Myxococcales bacterium]|nr:beta-lactamase family protein [Myxococcales bacterium]